jgi:hypothetical protein
VRSSFGSRGGQDPPAPSPREIAISRLMKQIMVNHDPRSYLITVAVTTSDPKRAARLANWVASEYLRGGLREQATEAYAAAEREVVGLSAVFGPRHPAYLNGLAKLERLREALDAARKGIAVAARRKRHAATGRAPACGPSGVAPEGVSLSIYLLSGTLCCTGNRVKGQRGVSTRRSFAEPDGAVCLRVEFLADVPVDARHLKWI